MTLPAKDTVLELINPETGERWPIDAMFDPKEGRWEKVFAKNLARMLDLVGDEKMKVVTYLIRHKDYLNVVNSTIREIAEETGVSTKTVNRVLKTLQSQNYLQKVRNGKYVFSPHVMRHGKASIGAAVITLYDKED